MAETLAREAERLARAIEFHDGGKSPCDDFYCNEGCSLKLGIWEGVLKFLRKASEDERIQ